MTRLKKLMIPALLLALPARAEPPVSQYSPKLELSAMSNGGIFFSDETSVAFLMGGAAYEVTPGLQLGVTGLYTRIGYDDGNYWGYAVLIGPTVNYPVADLRNAFYLTFKYGGGQVGGTAVSGASDTSRGMWNASLGKRFQLSQTLAYVPEVGVFKVVDAKHETDPVFRILPLGLSLFF
jgi:hypothetical protein